MMYWIYFLIAGVGYMSVASLPYTSLPADSPAKYYIFGTIISLMMNVTWLNLAGKLSKPDILVYGLVWDSILTVAYILTPIIFFQVQAKPQTLVGAALILGGMVLTKL